MTEKNTKETSRKRDSTESTALALPGFGLPRIFEEYMKPFDDFMGPLFPSSMSSLWTEFGQKEPNIDVQDRGDHFLLTAELPGFEKKDLEVQVSSNAVELKAEKKSEKPKSGANGKQVERSYSYFQRYLTLPERVRSGSVDGTMKNGVLELKLPKMEPTSKEASRRVHLN